MTDSEHSLPCTDPASTGTGVPAQPPPPVSASASRALPSSLVPLPSRCFLLKEDALSSKRLFVRPLQCGSLLLAQLCCLAECFLFSLFPVFPPLPPSLLAAGLGDLQRPRAVSRSQLHLRGPLGDGWVGGGQPDPVHLSSCQGGAPDHHGEW